MICRRGCAAASTCGPHNTLIDSHDALCLCLISPAVRHKLLTSYFELVQVGGALPVFVIADARHAGEADRYAVSGVHLGFGELGACDLPDGRLLQRKTAEVRKWRDKSTAAPERGELLLRWFETPRV